MPVPSEPCLLAATMSEASSHTESEGENILVKGRNMQNKPDDGVEAINGPAADEGTSYGSTVEGASTPPTRKVLVLTGLVGSGKSTFAESLCAQYPDQYKRACQDVIGSRQGVESYVLKQLQQGYDVCIDRTNVDPKQRSNWLKIAKESQDSQGVSVEIYSLFFDTPYDVCKARLQQRTTHETLHSPMEAVKVLNIFSRQLVPPHEREGFHKLIKVEPEWNAGPNGASQEEVDAVLQLLDDAPYAVGMTAGQPTKGATQSTSGSTQQRGGPHRPGRGYMNNRDPPRYGGNARPARQAWQRPPPWADQSRQPPSHDQYRSHPYQEYSQGYGGQRQHYQPYDGRPPRPYYDQPPTHPYYDDPSRQHQHAQQHGRVWQPPPR